MPDLIGANEICEELEITSSLLTQWRKELNLPEKSNRKKEIFYSQESYKKLVAKCEEYEAIIQERKERKKGIKLPKDIEELRKAHLLVTNDKCFIESWFPES